MFSHIAPDFEPVLRRAGLAGFDELWRLERNWIETPNKRRAGTSGVCRKTWDDPATGKPENFYVKYQKNHCRHTFRAPLFGEPTCLWEAEHLLELNRHGIATPSLSYYESKRAKGSWHAILITRELPGVMGSRWLRENPFDEQFSSRLAELIHRLHFHAGLEHRSLEIKNVWVRPESLALLDLEKARSWRWRMPFPIRDLARLIRSLRRSTVGVPDEGCIDFLRRYLELAGQPQRLERLIANFGLDTRSA
jgi:tRNA A-37 threonylcarbamoyl transferase component Bud32